MTIAGIGFSGRAQNNGMVFVKLKDWKLRDRPDLKVKAVAGRAMGAFSRIRNAMVFAFPPPAVVELGNAQGVDFQLMDRGGLGHAALMNARNQLLGMAAQDPRLTNVRPNGMEDVPEYRVDVDWEKAGALGVPITSIHDTIAARSRLERGIGLRNHTGAGEDHADGVFRGRDRVAAGRVHDHDALFRGSGNVYVIEAASGAADDLELRCFLQEPGRDLGGRPDDERVILADDLLNLFDAGLAPGIHFEPGFFQNLHPDG